MRLEGPCRMGESAERGGRLGRIHRIVLLSDPRPNCGSGARAGEEGKSGNPTQMRFIGRFLLPDAAEGEANPLGDRNLRKFAKSDLRGTVCGPI